VAKIRMAVSIEIREKLASMVHFRHFQALVDLRLRRKVLQQLVQELFQLCSSISLKEVFILVLVMSVDFSILPSVP